MENPTFTIVNLTVYSENETYKNGYIKVVDGKIAEVGSFSQFKQVDTTEVIELSPSFQVIPGAIDVHIHGVANADAMDGTNSALKTMAETLPKEEQLAF